MIHTRRLNLIPATAAILDAELDSREALSSALGAAVPEAWPPELYDHSAMAYARSQLLLGPAHENWWFYYFCSNGSETPKQAVGAGGFKGPPRGGSVEIGYSILKSYRRQGYATEAAMGLVGHAFKFSNVRSVTAETYPHLAGSIGVLKNCGFCLDGDGSEPGVVRYRIRKQQLS